MLGRYHYMGRMFKRMLQRAEETTHSSVSSKLESTFAKPNYVLLQLSNLSLSSTSLSPQKVKKSEKNNFPQRSCHYHCTIPRKEFHPQQWCFKRFTSSSPRLSYHQKILPPMAATQTPMRLPHTELMVQSICLHPIRYYKQLTSITVRFRFELPIYLCFPHTFLLTIL